MPRQRMKLYARQYFTFTHDPNAVAGEPLRLVRYFEAALA